MSLRELYTGPQFPSLESTAFEQLSTEINRNPESILYLTRQSHPEQPTLERWQRFGSSASLSITTFDGFVADCYEQDQYKGRVTHVDRPLLYRFVELGLEHLDDPTNPLNRGTTFPTAGFSQEAENLFTRLEFAGLLSPPAIRDRLEHEGLDYHADAIGPFAEQIEEARTNILADKVVETFRTERMAAVINTESSLAELMPSVEAVIVSDFSMFRPLERELLERIVETWPTIGIIPQLTDRERAVGVDAGAEQALDTFHELDFERTYVPISGNSETTTDSGISHRHLISQNLFQHPTTVGNLDRIDAAATEIELIQPETISREIRHVARDVRHRVSGGMSTDKIGVVVTDATAYRDQLVEVFDEYEIPVTVATDLPLTETAVGEAVQTMCGLAREPRLLRSMMDLLANPAVNVVHDGETVDQHELARIADRITTTRLEPALEHLDAEQTQVMEVIVREAEKLADSSLDELPEQVDALLEQLGINETVAEIGESSVRNPQLERAALERLERIVETVAWTEEEADLTQGNAVDRLERALHNISIQSSRQREEDHVIVCELSEAPPRSFEHTYVLGLTEGQFPSNPEKLAFTRPIYDAHPDFERTDMQQEGRYQFGILLASLGSITLSVPERSVDGDPFVEADVITELRRITGLDPRGLQDDEVPPGSQEDVQQSLNRVIASDDESDPTELITTASGAGTFEATQYERALAGTECAAARASPKLTPYDGHLSPETVTEVYDRGVREPYSSSRLETYAECGFKFYMERVLGIDEPDELTPEPEPWERGEYIHDVFEYYYRVLQSEEGEPVSLPGSVADREELLCTIALEHLETAFEEETSTAFQEEWLTTVLAGLGTPESNPYYGQERYDAPERGLFVRFLENESEEVAKATARPTWFEGRIGQPRGDETVLQEEPVEIETPNGTVPIGGMIDRIDTVPGTDPTQLVVRDYKTGHTPSESETLTGLSFQISLYALMAEAVLDNVETVGGAYYEVGPPADVNHRKGLISSQELTTWAGYDEAETPMTRWSYPTFETHAAFRRFLEYTVPERLGQLVHGITTGKYHPTVLDPDDAGCSYCPYSRVCDVRPHMRHETIDVIDVDDLDVYVPPIATDEEPEEVLEVE